MKQHTNTTVQQMKITHSILHGKALILLLSIATGILAAGQASAEGIFLNDGRVIYGRILNQGDTHMQIRTGYGVISVKKADIKRVDYDLGLGQVTAVLKTGDMITGTLISLTATKVVVKDSTIDHDIPRSEIENLVLSKFEGRRDNTLGITGGITRTMNTLKSQVPYGYIDLSAFYLRSNPALPFFQWGISLSYIQLSTNDAKTNLKNAKMTMCPMLADVRLKYPLFSCITSASWASKMDFFADIGAGTSYVTLSEGTENRTASYFSVQPSAGISISISERLYLVNQYDWLYIHQSKLSYTGARARFGAGFIF
jgi:hypothetical protein